MAEALSEKEKKSPRKLGPLLAGFGSSILWGLFAVQYVARNIADVQSLKPNEFGDLLAGFFAPLAFLWLFVATLLQRQELELQRLELTETRDVLAQQKEEMKRAAEENIEQTRIMSENLANDSLRNEYEQIDTLLYTTALYIFTNRHFFKVRDRSQSHVEYIRSNELDQFEINKTSFDGIYVAVLNSLRHSNKIIQRNPSEWQVPGPEHEQVARDTYARLKKILALSTDRNTLVKARLDGLSFSELVKLFRSVQQFELQE